MKKQRVGFLFGGQSAEHEVSLQSAKSIISALNREKYEPILIGIDKSGHWFSNDEANFLLNSENPKLISLNHTNALSQAIVPGQNEYSLISCSKENPLSMQSLDVVFPILHGPFGEDGTMQGLLKIAGLPFVGSDVLGSAISMDKDVTKRLLKEAGLPIGKFLSFRQIEKSKISYDEVSHYLGKTVFVKPANMGSSVGVSKVRNKTEFDEAIEIAFQHDRKILIEEFTKGKELECAILGNENPKASVVGEIILNDDFYSYDTKYINDDGAKLTIPADLPLEISESIRQLAIKVFQTLECEGLARVDFFLTNEEQLYVNELNAIPGFTKISMYPKLWEATGLSYSDLIDELIQLAVARHRSF